MTDCRYIYLIFGLLFIISLSKAMLLSKQPVPEYREPIAMDRAPSAKSVYVCKRKVIPFFWIRWLLHAYTIDVYRRLPQFLAAVYGSILKIASTKKACKKLQGHAAGAATWVTNMGNERGEVLVSLLKGLSSL